MARGSTPYLRGKSDFESRKKNWHMKRKEIFLIIQFNNIIPFGVFLDYAHKTV